MRRAVTGALGVLVVAFLAVEARANPTDVQWISGPRNVDLGADVAQIQLPEAYVFAGAEDTRKLMESMGNTASNDEVGLISPKDDAQDWFMIFEYRPEGYVKDDDKDKIDKDAILKSYQEGTEEANKLRKERGVPGIHVTGWFEEPHYDAATHNLVWALNARSDDGHDVVNYNVRVLGRQGFMSITLVDSPTRLAQSKPEVQKLLDGFGYKQGKSYAEWIPGDKVAAYGLTALVAGGAGAAAAKLGLFAVFGKFFAKAGKAIIVAIVAVFAALKKLFSSLSSRRQSE
jgi:uncharacterized membrane-anchored protein